MIQFCRLIILVDGTLAMLTMSNDDVFDTCCAENCQSCVLCGFGHSEENEPQHTFGSCADRQAHLGKGDDITGNA